MEVIYMNYKELLYNKDKILTFYPELAVILNKFDEIESKRISEETGELKKPDKTGLNKAIFLNQLNYWIELNEQAGINFEDGYYWSYSSYPKMIERDFPYWSVDTLKRAVTSLEKYGIVISANYNSMKMDKKKWYRIDYKRLQEVIDIVKHHDELTNSDVNAICPDVDAKCTDDDGNVSRAIEENRYNKDYSSKENNDKDFILSNKEKETLPSDGKDNQTSAPNNYNKLNIYNIPPRTKEQKANRYNARNQSSLFDYKDEDVENLVTEIYESIYGAKENIFEDHDICLSIFLITEFFKKYQKYREEKHPMVTQNQAENILKMIRDPDTDMAKDDLVDDKEEPLVYLEMMEEHFKTKWGKKNGGDFNYRIMLFFKDTTQNLLYQRVKHKREDAL